MVELAPDCIVVVKLAQVELTPWRLHHGERAPYHGACTIELAPWRVCTIELEPWSLHHRACTIELAPWRLHLRACTIYYDN